MRKGHNLEHQINKLIKYLDSIGVHAHKNNPERLFDGTFIKGESFDYEIIYKNRIICFDAKECHSDVWRPDQKKDLKQANNLLKCKVHGAESFFLVYFFTFKILVKYDVEMLKSFKTLTPEQGSQLKNILEILGESVSGRKN